MSKRLATILGGVVLALGLFAGGIQGCGGGGGTKALCDDFCNKGVSCIPDASAAMTDPILAQCKQTCTTNTGTQCTNSSAIIAAAKACLDVTCDQLEACSETIPECQGGGGGSGGGSGSGGASGTGGTNGSGGTNGTGGSGGTGAWSCAEDLTSGCGCTRSSGGTQTTCAGTWSCCSLSGSGASETCICSNLATDPCNSFVSGGNGTKVSTCPPP
jgi:hypothetical protein